MNVQAPKKIGWHTVHRSKQINHNLTQENNGNWACIVCMVRNDGLYSKKVRFPLKTKDVVVARKRRDRMIKLLNEHYSDSQTP